MHLPRRCVRVWDVKNVVFVCDCGKCPLIHVRGVGVQEEVLLNISNVALSDLFSHGIFYTRIAFNRKLFFHFNNSVDCSFLTSIHVCIIFVLHLISSKALGDLHIDDLLEPEGYDTLPG